MKFFIPVYLLFLRALRTHGNDIDSDHANSPPSPPSFLYIPTYIPTRLTQTILIVNTSTLPYLLFSPLLSSSLLFSPLLSSSLSYPSRTLHSKTHFYHHHHHHHHHPSSLLLIHSKPFTTGPHTRPRTRTTNRLSVRPSIHPLRIMKIRILHPLS